MRFIIIISLIALLFGSFQYFDNVSPVETAPVNLVDHQDDVKMTTEVDEIVPGWKDIDLISLKAVEEGSKIKVTMTVEGKINSGSGYRYEIWMYYDYVFYRDGIFEFDRDIEDGVTAEVSGSSIIFLLEKSALTDSYWDLSGEAYYFTSKEKTPGYEYESYSDEIPDFDYEPFRRSTGDFDRDLEDEKGDVQHSYSDKTRVGDYEFMDIISLDVVLDSNGDYIFTLTLKGDVAYKGDLDYKFGTDNVSIWYGYDGNIFERITYEETNEKTEGVTAKDNTITATIDSFKIGEIDGLYAYNTYEEYKEETGEMQYFEDGLDDEPVDEDYIESKLIAYGDIMKMKMDLRFQGLDEAVLKITMDYPDGAYMSDLRYALDRDMNGIVEAGEIHEDEILFIKDHIENDRFGLDLKVDNISGEISAVYSLEGLLGNVNDESGIQITAVVTYSFNIAENTIHKIELRSLVENKDDGSGYDEWDFYEDFYFNISHIGNMMDLVFITPVGWRIQTSSIHPSSMTGFVNDLRNMVKLPLYDISKIMDPEVELFKFDIKMEGGDGWDDLDTDFDDDDENKDLTDDGDDKKKDSPLPIWTSFLSFMIVAALIILFERRKR